MMVMLYSLRCRDCKTQMSQNCPSDSKTRQNNKLNCYNTRTFQNILPKEKKKPAELSKTAPPVLTGSGQFPYLLYKRLAA